MRTMNKTIVLIFFGLIFSWNRSRGELLAQTSDLARVEAKDILNKADAALIPTNAKFRWSLSIKKGNSAERSTFFLGFKKGALKYMFYTYAPASSYGQCHLRIDTSIWIYYPMADYTVRTSYKSAFLDSGLSYADVMYDELSRSYGASILERGASIVGCDHSFIKLELKALPGAIGYDRIVCYIDEATFKTERREYYSRSGELLKIIRFSSYEQQGKMITGFSMTIEDLLNPGVLTTARFWNITVVEDVPEQYFSLGFIKSWQPETKE